MKASFAILLLTFAVAGVFGGSIYDAKDEAKKEVENRYKAVKSTSDRVLKTVEKEEKLDKDTETETIKSAQDKKCETEKQFAENIIKTTRTAIAKGKPLSAIDCIAKVDTEAKILIPQTLENFEKIMSTFKQNRLEALKFARTEVGLIMSALEGLKSETITLIDKAKEFQTLKNDFQRKAETADKQLDDIDKRTTQFNIKDEYKKLRNNNANKNKEDGEFLAKKLQKCIA